MRNVHAKMFVKDKNGRRPVSFALRNIQRGLALQGNGDTKGEKDIAGNPTWDLKIVVHDHALHERSEFGLITFGWVKNDPILEVSITLYPTLPMQVADIELRI